MKWIEINKDNRPEFDEQVLVTDKNLNKEENCTEMSVCYLDHIKTDSLGSKLVWEDVHNSGIINPTHYCEIPKLVK